MKLKHTITTALLAALFLVPATTLAHGHHRSYKVVIVKPAPPRTKVVIVRTEPRYRCRYGCWYGPRRALAHALVDYVWWESRR